MASNHRQKSCRKNVSELLPDDFTYYQIKVTWRVLEGEYNKPIVQERNFGFPTL